MHVARFAQRSNGVVATGLVLNDEILPFRESRSIGEMLRLTRDEFRIACEAGPFAPPLSRDDVVLLPPVDGRTDVWAAGVTYRRSREARTEESEEPSIYERVYEADRPELFFKSVAWRVVGDQGPVTIRADSPLNVPEAELGLVVNAHTEIVGLTASNDMSSRSLEGENPLYLPQAKIYLGACALGPAIRPIWEVHDPRLLDIRCTIRRGGGVAFEGQTNTSEMHRSPEELVEYLFREDIFPEGAVLSTGTGIVPGMEFTLEPDDEIEVAIDEVGVLRNSVVRGKAGADWVAAGLSSPRASLEAAPS